MERKASVNSQGDSAEAQFWAQEQAQTTDRWADQGSNFVPATVVPNAGGEREDIYLSAPPLFRTVGKSQLSGLVSSHCCT